MNEAVQFVVILGSLTVLVVGAVGVPLILGFLGAHKLKALGQQLVDLEQRNEARLAELDERLDFSERILQQLRERGGLPRGESPG